ncbi:early nodulin 3 [Olea europaea subsp. europaea]|uniref:Early nodulin 3 n=1 Tax=Olea europaea subsp. europaea TaxID=158383 RepID=A0A8S0USC6_OLEEU|nr:early nodulin 3 [Olea europaea subsp. europaea]
MEPHPAAFRPPWPLDPTTNRTTSLLSITYTQPPAINSPKSDENGAQNLDLPQSFSTENHCSGDTHAGAPLPIDISPLDDHNHGFRSTYGASNQLELHLKFPPMLPAESLPLFQFFDATSGTHNGKPRNIYSSHHGKHPHHMGLHQFHPNLANRTDPIPQGQKSDSLLIDPTNVFDSAIKCGVNEIQAPNTLSNVLIAEITSLICRILESNVPKCTQTEAVGTVVFGNYTTGSKSWKTPRINTLPPSISQTVRTINARVPPARKQPPPPRATPRATATSTTAHSGPKSYAAAVGNVPVVSQAERSQKKEQKRQQASTSGAHVSQADPPTVAQSIASIVATALVNPPIVQSVAPDTIAPSSAITPALALSQPVINIDSDYTDPLVHDMSRRTHDSEAIDTVVRQLPGPTPGRIASEFVVGGENNLWAVPSFVDKFNKWAKKTHFQIGDSLVLKYDFKTNSVLEVIEKD